MIIHYIDQMLTLCFTPDIKALFCLMQTFLLLIVHKLLSASSISMDGFTSELVESVSQKDTKGCRWDQYHMLKGVKKHLYLMP